MKGVLMDEPYDLLTDAVAQLTRIANTLDGVYRTLDSIKQNMPR